jgi:predicted ATP-dependent serine protease
MSQYKNISVSKSQIFVGEIALSGQVKQSKQHVRRCNEVNEQFSLVDYTKVKHMVELPTVL